MKRNILLLAIISFMAAAYANQPISNAWQSKSAFALNGDYRDCIRDCNACISSSINCKMACSKMQDSKMDKCIQLCKESIATCTASIELMQLNSENAQEMCLTCAKVCDRCAAECDKFDTKECKLCAEACRKASDSCKHSMK